MSEGIGRSLYRSQGATSPRRENDYFGYIIIWVMAASPFTETLT